MERKREGERNPNTLTNNTITTSMIHVGGSACSRQSTSVVEQVIETLWASLELITEGSAKAPDVQILVQEVQYIHT